METYLKGLLIGLAYVAPIGAQNMFVINTAIAQPRRRAYLTALIVTFFDVTLALACFFGIGAVMEHFPVVKTVMLGVGSLVILWMGIGLIRSKGRMEQADGAPALGWLKTAGKACVVTWCNPQAILDGTMLIGASVAGLAAGQSKYFIMGTTSASVIWFVGITTLITLFSARISDKLLRILNIICGAVMIFYALKLIYTFITVLTA